MMTAKLQEDNLTVSLAILLAWVGITSVMTFAPYLKKLLGDRGLVALEQVMGLMLALVSTGLLFKGITFFIHSLS
jgi:multiple antibiotic resistance protein